MHFAKYHALGNDYLVVDPSRFPLDPTPASVRAICDRNYGVGSDGILYGPLGGAPGTPRGLRIFNPDGSEAEKSGNGLRIFAWYLHEEGYEGTGPFRVATKGGTVTASIVDETAGMVAVDMGPPSFAAADIPVEAGLPEVVDRELVFGGRALRVTCVSMGNPHCVVMLPGATEADARELGPIVENAPIFPRRTNVQFIESVGKGELRIRVWERGAGYTLASGSSSCAAAAAARRLGLAGDELRVLMPGGALDIRFEGGSVHMTGPVEKVFGGDFAPCLAARLDLLDGRPPC